jgi:hypothetical protein
MPALGVSRQTLSCIPDFRILCELDSSSVVFMNTSRMHGPDNNAMLNEFGVGGERWQKVLACRKDVCQHF